ncbi:hypothetical protein ACLEPN_30485 [Myxococcus sp. 1LA]
MKHHHIVTGIASAVLGGALLLALDARRSRPQQLEITAGPAALALPPPAHGAGAEPAARSSTAPSSTATKASTAPSSTAAKGLWAGIAADMGPTSRTEDLASEAAVLVPPPPRPPSSEPEGAARWGRATPGERGQALGTWPSAPIGGLEPWQSVPRDESPPKGGNETTPPIVQPNPGVEWS